MITLEDLARTDEIHEERFDRLEEILGRFIVQTGVSIRHMNAAINRMDTSISRMDTSIEQMGKSVELLRVEAVRDRQQWNERFEKMNVRLEQDRQQMNAQLEQDRQQWNARFEQMDVRLEQDRLEWNARFEQMDAKSEQNRQEWSERFEQMDAKSEQDRQKWNKRFEQMDAKSEQDRQEWNERFEQMDVRAEKHRREIEIQADKDRKEADARARKDRREWNKHWGELANKLGTLVEDIVAPNILGIGKNFFNIDVVDDFMVRRKIRHKRDRSKQQEFDVILVGTNRAGEEVVLLNETKSTPRLPQIDSFINVLQEITEYVPEYKDKTIIPIFSSLYMGDDIITYLTRHGIYAMSMGEETMTLVNFEAIELASS